MSEKINYESQLKKAGLQGEVRIAAEVPKRAADEIDNEMGDHLKRTIPKDYDYDPRALKPLARTLWAMSVALGHAMTAHRQFTKIKSSTVSPDGLIGGRGYVMSVKDIRKALYDACENLSAISDTLHDELRGPHWKPKLAELEENDIEGVERLVGEAEHLMDNPDSDVQEDMSEAEDEGDRAEMEEGESGSELPEGDDMPEAVAPLPSERVKQASMAVVEAYLRKANSSLPVETMSGPRVQHMDRGDVDQTGPFGSYNSEEPGSIKDDWSKNDGVGQSYNYQSDWDNELLDKTAVSAPGTQCKTDDAFREFLEKKKLDTRSSASFLPGKLTDNTPTEADDFGLGYGNGNDAHGQGLEGDVYGPYSGLPNDPAGKKHDNNVSDTTPIIEHAVGQSSMPKHAQSEVPEPFRSDYDSGIDAQPGLSERHEQSQPYIKWDSNTHNMRPDYTYQRDRQGPYVKQEG